MTLERKSMFKVNRELFLSQLDSVYPGISPKEIIEQSSCFVFKDGQVITYNDEVACQHSVDDVPLHGAVQADPLLKILRKLPEEEVSIEAKDGELLIHGKKRRVGIRMEADITLPIDSIEAPGKWRDLNPEFTDAIDVVKNTASKDQTSFAITCVHITPDCVESTDNTQISRYVIETGFKERVLLRRESVKHIVGLGMSKFSMSKTWIHFKNKRGLIFSCRQYSDEFPVIDEYLNAKGVKTQLPKGLVEAAEKAAVFSSENDDNQVILELRDNKVKITGQGLSGWFSEIKKIDYTGVPMKFMMSPELLSHVASQHNECWIADRLLRVSEGKYTYVTCLYKDEPQADSTKE